MIKRHLSECTKIGLKLTVGKSAQAKKGIGRCLWVVAKALKVTHQTDKREVGFKLNAQQEKKQAQKNQEKKIAHMLG